MRTMHPRKCILKKKGGAKPKNSKDVTRKKAAQVLCLSFRRELAISNPPPTSEAPSFALQADCTLLSLNLNARQMHCTAAWYFNIHCSSVHKVNMYTEQKIIYSFKWQLWRFKSIIKDCRCSPEKTSLTKLYISKKPSKLNEPSSSYLFIYKKWAMFTCLGAC